MATYNKETNMIELDYSRINKTKCKEYMRNKGLTGLVKAGDLADWTTDEAVFFMGIVIQTINESEIDEDTKNKYIYVRETLRGDQLKVERKVMVETFDREQKEKEKNKKLNMQPTTQNLFSKK